MPSGEKNTLHLLYVGGKKKINEWQKQDFGL